MKRTPITHNDVETLLTGHAPPGRPELDELADLLAGLRQATPPPPTPSLQLAAWIHGHQPIPTTTAKPRPARRRLAAWIAGLSIGAHVALGTAAAAAALTGAGIADALPDVMQRPFDDVRDRLGLIERNDSAPSPSEPGRNTDLPPAQDSVVTESEVGINEEIPPAPSGPNRPDPGPPQDDSAEEPTSDKPNTEPGSHTTPELETDQDPDTSDNQSESDHDEEPNPQSPDTQDSEPTDEQEPDELEDDARDDVISDAPDAVKNDPETSNPDPSADGGTSDETRPDDPAEPPSDEIQAEHTEGSSAQ